MRHINAKIKLTSLNHVLLHTQNILCHLSKADPNTQAS